MWFVLVVLVVMAVFFAVRVVVRGVVGDYAAQGMDAGVDLVLKVGGYVVAAFVIFVAIQAVRGG